jgi:hypothetical protein
MKYLILVRWTVDKLKSCENQIIDNLDSCGNLALFYNTKKW